MKIKEDIQGKVWSTGKAVGLSSTHFVAVRKSTRQVETGEEPGEVDRSPDKKADSFNKYSLRTYYVSNAI